MDTIKQLWILSYIHPDSLPSGALRFTPQQTFDVLIKEGSKFTAIYAKLSKFSHLEKVSAPSFFYEKKIIDRSFFRQKKAHSIISPSKKYLPLHLPFSQKTPFRERAKFMRNPGRDYRQGGTDFFLREKKGGEDLFGEKKKGAKIFFGRKKGAGTFFEGKNVGRIVFLTTKSNS